jgi:cell division septation protein DedD
MDPDMRRMGLFAAGVASVLAVLIGASFFTGRHGGTVPVVTADTRPIREKPANPGGMKIDGTENDLFSGGSDTSNVKLAPPAEAPDTKALRAAAASPAAPAAVAPPVAPPLPPAAKPPAVAAAAAPPPLPPAAKPAAVPAGKAMVQLAALGTEELARNEWQLLARKMPDLLNGRQPNFSRIERDGHTFWRVRTAGFADAAQARAFCEQVRAKGGGCSVAEF